MSSCLCVLAHPSSPDGNKCKSALFVPQAIPMRCCRREKPAKPSDDDSNIRDIVSGFLSELGYEVRDVPHGEAALAVLDRFDPDLSIIDFAMTAMNGAETAQAIRERNARLPILFLSGFADSAALEAAVGDAPILRKPFRPIELAAAVRSALDASHS